MPSIEAIVLTGGGSRRMGQDKSKLLIDGIPQAERIVRQFVEAGIPVTVLGREMVEGAAFLKDREDFGGPIAALSAFHPTADFIFVASCDLPRFDFRLVHLLLERIGDREACAPETDGFRQPLCALYAKGAFEKLATLEDQCAMGWLNVLNATIIKEPELIANGIDPAVTRGANTPEELADMMGEVVR